MENRFFSRDVKTSIDSEQIRRGYRQPFLTECFLLVAKVVKLWRIAERCKELGGSNLEDETGQSCDPQNVTSLRLPVLKTVMTYVEASPRRIYNNVHAYFVNSLSVNSDQETFLSADDLRINIWHLDFTNKHFSMCFHSLIGFDLLID